MVHKGGKDDKIKENVAKCASARNKIVEKRDAFWRYLCFFFSFLAFREMQNIFFGGETYSDIIHHDITVTTPLAKGVWA